MRLAVAVACVALLAGTAVAHPPPRGGERELVRVRGHLAEAKDGGTPLVLTALGREHRFAAAEFRTFGFGDTPDATPTASRFTLQGPRDLLARFVAARPDQTVVILADHRSGSSDLFVLALDLCPSQ